MVMEHFKPLLVLFLPTFALNIYKSMDKIMLEKLVNVSEVGLYEYAERIMTLPTLFIIALGTVMLPKISNLFSQNKLDEIHKYNDKSIEFVLFLSIPITFGLIGVANNFIPIFLGNSYLKTIQLLQLLSISITFISLSNVVQTQYLIPNEKDKDYIIALLLGATINFILNIILIFRFDSYGACVATIVSELFVMTYQFYKTRGFYNLKKYFLLYMKYILKGAIMFVFIYSVNFININNFSSLIIKIILGTIIYYFINVKYINQNIDIKRLLRR